MQFKLAFVTAALASLAVATPTARDSCSTGSLTCCNSIQSTSGNPLASLLAGLLGLTLGDLGLNIGLTCSPITVIGVGNNGCTAQTVCCEDNSNSLISLGCVPIQL
ncbi:hypothetical protein GYMLUDRAFT_244528 [Collybiopsis luxurians FD-317 M1]|uniref:Hydrophobin n=1 Tax=Collybiopsis luxurians FD-317 M1 TaxID=944289 RepID=A0A0D0BA46_9AGAR|nr:hypothetical protein GYMLUDRAFT_244528 [Collybiopsis luxurians FD-317 M1]